MTEHGAAADYLPDRLGVTAERLGATFMLPGNVYNFGTGMPARLDETTPERPSTEKGRIRRALEQLSGGAAGHADKRQQQYFGRQ